MGGIVGNGIKAQPREQELDREFDSGKSGAKGRRFAAPFALKSAACSADKPNNSPNT